MYHVVFGVIKTTRNIWTSPSLIILCEVWAKPIMFIGTQLGVSLTTFKLEVKGRTLEHKNEKKEGIRLIIFNSPNKTN